MSAPLLLGLDLGSSSIKAALVDSASRQALALAQSPAHELAIDAPQPGWAEQNPAVWWEHCVAAVRNLAALIDGGEAVLRDIAAIGITYQMHGLVLLDAHCAPLRPAIIWCDSRAAALGHAAEGALGTAWCLEHLLNTPGNFTAAKLAWVKLHQPELYVQARYAMLPGDYLAQRLTGQAATTASGLSEMTLWDFRGQRLAAKVLDCLGLEAALLPQLVPTFGAQGRLTAAAAAELGLAQGIPVSYRAGDQPSNALSLGALEPGAIAATAGTSGVLYWVTDQACSDPAQRVNTFLHVNHQPHAPRYGVLLCLNGAGSSYRWLRDILSTDGTPSYTVLNALAEQTAPGADGLSCLPFGNGAERMLGGRAPGASLHGLDFNRHGAAQLARAVQEGVAYALAYGMESMRELGLAPTLIRAGAANMFLSDVFTTALAAATGVAIERRGMTNATGAALGAGCGAGLFASPAEALSHGARSLVEATASEQEQYAPAYARWKALLAQELAKD